MPLPAFLTHGKNCSTALQVLGSFACALECSQRGAAWVQLINITGLWWNCARPIFNQVCSSKHYSVCRLQLHGALNCNIISEMQALPTVSSTDGLQVPVLTQPTAKATWQVDTAPPVEDPMPTGKASAAKAGAAKSGAQASKAATPTNSGPLPSDALEEDVPSGPIRYRLGS